MYFAFHQTTFAEGFADKEIGEDTIDDYYFNERVIAKNFSEFLGKLKEV